MTREVALKKLTEVFRDVFDDDELIITESTTPDDIDDWDSLENINIIASVKTEFSIDIGMNEITSLKSVGDIVNVITERCKE